MRTRIISGAVLTAILVGAVAGGRITMFLLSLVITCLGMFELYRVVGIHKSHLGLVGYILAAAYYALLWFDKLEFMDLITFILVIASLVQLTEMFIKKTSPALYKSLGVYLPLITTNCVVLNVCLVNISKSYNFAQMLVYSIGTPLGFALVLFIFSTIRERLEQSEVPTAFVGNPIALIVAAIMAMAFSCFTGIV